MLAERFFPYCIRSVRRPFDLRSDSFIHHIIIILSFFMIFQHLLLKSLWFDSFSGGTVEHIHSEMHHAAAGHDSSMDHWIYCADGVVRNYKSENESDINIDDSNRDGKNHSSSSTTAFLLSPSSSLLSSLLDRLLRPSLLLRRIFLASNLEYSIICSNITRGNGTSPVVFQ